MNTPLPAEYSRRHFLRTTGVVTAAAWAGIRSRASAAPPSIQLLDTKIISQQPEYYHGWPTVARRANGELWVTCSGGRQAHVCPFGQVVAMTSRDNGATWTYRASCSTARLTTGTPA